MRGRNAARSPRFRRRSHGFSMSPPTRACWRIATGSPTVRRRRRCWRCTGSKARARRTTCADSPRRPSPPASTWSASTCATAAAPNTCRAGLYHSGLTADPLAVLTELRDRDRLTRFAVAGYSMGGNVTMKLAGELGATDFPEVQGICRRVAGDRARSVHAVDRAAREPHLRMEFLPQPAGPHAAQVEAFSHRSSISTGCGRFGRFAPLTTAIPRRTMASTAPRTTTTAPARCA